MDEAVGEAMRKAGVDTTLLILSDHGFAPIGDHCMSAHEVPGVLFSNRKIRAAEPDLTHYPPRIWSAARRGDDRPDGVLRVVRRRVAPGRRQASAPSLHPDRVSRRWRAGLQARTPSLSLQHPRVPSLATRNPTASSPPFCPYISFFG